MNILIINQPLGNRGDQAAYRSLVRGLNKEFGDSQILTLYLNGVDNSIEQYHVENPSNCYLNLATARGHGAALRLGFRFRLTRLFLFLHPSHRKVANLLRDSDLVICSPGGVCLGPYQNWDHLWLLSVSLLLKKKVVYFGRSFGPFLSENSGQRLFKKVALKALRAMDFISIRDKVSQEYADGLKLQYEPTVDTAFLDVPDTDIPTQIRSELGDKYIIFVPNELSWNPMFIEANFALLEEYYLLILERLLRFDEHNIIMLPQIFNHDQHGDFKYFKQLKQKSNNHSRIRVLPDSLGSDLQQKIIGGSDYVVGARYHSVVFALNNHIPFSALSYETKISGLLSLLGLDSNCSDFSFLFTEDIKAAKLSLVTNVDAIESTVWNILKENEKQKVKNGDAKNIAWTSFRKFVSRYQSKNDYRNCNT